MPNCKINNFNHYHIITNIYLIIDRPYLVSVVSCIQWYYIINFKFNTSLEVNFLDIYYTTAIVTTQFLVYYKLLLLLCSWCIHNFLPYTHRHNHKKSINYIRFSIRNLSKVRVWSIFTIRIDDSERHNNTIIVVKSIHPLLCSEIKNIKTPLYKKKT